MATKVIAMHPRYAPVLSGFLVSGLMSLIVSGIGLVRTVGLTAEMPALWVAGWLPSWAVAFPTVLVVAPTVRRLVAGLVRAG